MENGVKLYPLWKDTVERIISASKEDPEAVFSDRELSEWLDVPAGTDEFRFSLLKIRDYLQKNEGIFLIRVKGSGYKIANDEEKVSVVTEAYQRRAKNAFLRQRLAVLSTDPSKLSDEGKVKYQAWLTRNSLQMAFLEQTGMHKLEKLHSVRMDRPSLVRLIIETDEDDA